MFGRRPPTAQHTLSDQIRQVAARSSAPASAPAAPKRRASRTAQFKTATLILDTGEMLKAAIIDVSETGLRLQSHVHDALPAEFTVSEPLLKLRRRVRVVWQEGGAAGVQFIG